MRHTRDKLGLDEGSWVLGSKYLNCMIGCGKALIEKHHFFRPSDVYTKRLLLDLDLEERQKKDPPPRDDLQKIKDALKREYPGTNSFRALFLLIKAFKAAALHSDSLEASLGVTSASGIGALATGLAALSPVASLSVMAGLHAGRVMSPAITKRLLVRRMNKMDADYLRGIVRPAVEGYCKRNDDSSFLQLPDHRSGASSAAARATDQTKMPPAARGASRVVAESSDISDGAEDQDDEVEREQRTSNFLQKQNEIEVEVSAVPSAWPTDSIGGADVGRAWKTRWGGAVVSRKKAEDKPEQAPEPSKDLLASQGDADESDHEQPAIEEN
eukprot:g12887.t1